MHIMAPSCNQRQSQHLSLGELCITFFPHPSKVEKVGHCPVVKALSASCSTRPILAGYFIEESVIWRQRRNIGRMHLSLSAFGRNHARLLRKRLIMKFWVVSFLCNMSIYRENCKESRLSFPIEKMHI